MEEPRSHSATTAFRAVQDRSTWSAGQTLLILFAVALIAGCGDGRPKRFPISGVVLIDGKPLTHGSIQFIPTEGRSGGGSLDDAGRFTVTCFEPGDGLPPGTYRVQVKGIEPMGEVAQRWHAPKKYANATTSGLEFVVDSARDDVTIDLEWDGGQPFVERF